MKFTLYVYLSVFFPSPALCLLQLDVRLRELPQSLPDLLREKMARVESEVGAQNVRLLIALLENAESGERWRKRFALSVIHFDLCLHRNRFP